MATSGRADRRSRSRFEHKARVHAVAGGQEVEICHEASEPVVLHWGLGGRGNEPWQCPPDAVWPPGTRASDGRAVETPFGDSRKLVIRIPPELGARSLVYVFHFPESNRWDNCRGRDYAVELTPGPDEPARIADRLVAWAPDAGDWEKQYSLGGGGLGVRVRLAENRADLWLVSDLAPPLVLHWGLGYASPLEWRAPAADCLPTGSRRVNDQAAETPFAEDNGLAVLRLSIPRGTDPPPQMLQAVLYQPELGRWSKEGGEDLHIRLFAGPKAGVTLDRPELGEIAEQIVAAEVGRSSWTLMHRFDLCSELLERAQGDGDALALLFVWLRFSAIRQLDWQRRYNTQPRILAHAQDRLTRRIAGLWRRYPAARPWVRRLLTTVGRGGEGQRIRDDILNIMHRHHVREHAGHFLEQWHQKLHNNATPDDLGICRAYLAFLRSDGDVKAFDRVLEEHGLTRERLRSYERPITTSPEFHPEAKAGLIADFTEYLRLLQSVHTSTDLASAIDVVRRELDDELGGALDELRTGNDTAEMALVTRSLELGLRARVLLAARLERTKDDGLARDLVYLELALLDQVRVTVERLPSDGLDLQALGDLLDAVVHHLALSGESDELALIAKHWRRLGGSGRLRGRDRALHAWAIAERMARALGDQVTATVAAIQPKAEELGRALGVDSWTIPPFSEEVVRGSPLFGLSRLLGMFGPLLRREAELGAWELICPGAGAGRVVNVDELAAVQGQSFPEPTVLLCRVVRGEEEIPSEVVAVLTLDRPDVLSHVAVRARNAGVLLASCYDRGAWAKLAEHAGDLLEVASTPSGDLVWRPGESARAPSRPAPAVRGRTSRPACSRFAVDEAEYSAERVGGKSRHLARLRQAVPPWLRIPPSFAIPFGVFEAVLDDDRNRELARHYRELLSELDRAPADTLAELRRAVLGLDPPPALIEAVTQVAARAGVELSGGWERCWPALKAVWASRWNDRAYYARRAQDLGEDDFAMAVLVQPVVAAEYAFVLHTVNPVTRQSHELYGEMVWGLGESLVGNYPGRALSFVAPKPEGPVRIVGFPSKTHALGAEGLIFRSDSNAEDLAGYAGAGLYDSVTTEPVRRVMVDYATAALLWDAGVAARVLDRMAEVGRVVEQALGSPQDVEGAWLEDTPWLLQARAQVGLR